MTACVYLLHFDAPLGNLTNPRAQAQHYLGWAMDLAERLAQHAAGRGAAITRAAVERGISWRVFVLGAGDYTLEKTLKAKKNTARLCPICGQRHPGGRLHVHGPAVDQLPLDLDDDPFAAVPLFPQYGPMDRYEYLVRRSWRSSLVPALSLPDTSGCDIPY